MVEFTFEELIGDLAHTSWEVRQMTCEDLAQLGDVRAIPHLARMLSDPVGAVRYASAEAMGRLGTEDIYAPLMACFNNPLFGSYAPVLEALGNLRKWEAIGLFLQFLRDPDSRTRGVANTALMVTTGKSMGFRTNAPDDAREASVRKWEEWYQQYLQECGATAATHEPEAAVESSTASVESDIVAEPASDPQEDSYAAAALSEAQTYAATFDPNQMPADLLNLERGTDDATDAVQGANPADSEAGTIDWKALEQQLGSSQPAATDLPPTTSPKAKPDLFASFFKRKKDK